MYNLILVKSRMFGNINCNCWQDTDNEIYITSEQIGSALEYSDPTTAISKIHSRHKERLDKFSVHTKLVGTDGKCYNTTIYNARGIYEICRWSRQTKANEFFDWVWDLLEGIRTGELIILRNKIEETKEIVEDYNTLTSANGYLSMLEVGRSLKVGRNKLLEFLRKEKILMSIGKRKNLAYERYIKQNYFKSILCNVNNSGESKDIVITTVSPKGLDFIIKLARKKGFINNESQVSSNT